MSNARNIAALSTVEVGATADQTKSDIDALGINRGRKNLIINGGMQVAQRGTQSGIISSDYYGSCDRWAINRSTGTWTLSQESDAPNGLSKSLKALVTSTGSKHVAVLRQYIEGNNVVGVAKGTTEAKPLTLSFWTKSNVTGNYTVELYDTDNSRHISAVYSISSSATWEYKQVTFPADSTGAFNIDSGASLQLFYWLNASTSFTSGTQATSSWASATNSNRVNSDIPNFQATTGNYFQITGVQLELGSVATDFEHATSYGETLALCQRYCIVRGAVNAVYTGASTGISQYFVDLPQTMKSTPTVIVYGVGGYPSSANNYDKDGVGNVSVNVAPKRYGFTVYNLSGSGQFGYKAEAEL